MKNLLLLFFAGSSFLVFGQKTDLKHLWYVENSVRNGKGKMTITLTLDSTSRQVKENTCFGIYNFGDSTYYQSESCYPTNTTHEINFLAAGTYSEGVWTLDSQGNLKLMVIAGKKKYVSEYMVSQLSGRKVQLTEK